MKISSKLGGKSESYSLQFVSQITMVVSYLMTDDAICANCDDALCANFGYEVRSLYGHYKRTVSCTTEIVGNY